MAAEASHCPGRYGLRIAVIPTAEQKGRYLDNYFLGTCLSADTANTADLRTGFSGGCFVNSMKKLEYLLVVGTTKITLLTSNYGIKTYIRY